VTLAPSLVQELSACCLLGKIWGEVLALAAIVNKTKKDWSFLKGQSSFVDIGNDWFLLRFASAEDRNLVYANRPWFVNGLNLVLRPWIPFFNPFMHSITHVDQ